MRAVLDYIAKTDEDGELAQVFGGADHDVIWPNVPCDLESDSAEFKMLEELGMYFDESIDSWVIFA
jgi:hypothetical protein